MGSTLTTFEVALGTEVNGLTVDAAVGPGGGILFRSSLGNGRVSIGVGPNTTNNINQPGIVSNPGDNNSGVLTMTFPSLVEDSGMDILCRGPAPSSTARHFSLFNGATPVGSLSFTATPDPVVPGGFAGIRSTFPFNRVEVDLQQCVGGWHSLSTMVAEGPQCPPFPSTTLILLGSRGAGDDDSRARPS